MLNDGELEAAEVIMDMTTITVTDITSEASKAKLVAHLKSADFFDAENHNTARFKSTSIKRSPTEKNVYEVTGDLTIKGITKPVTFNCTFMKEGDIYHGVGTLVFDRTQYDIKYRSGAFFPDIGDKMIYDEVRLDLDIRTR